jgi:hypothetical protein
MTDKLESQVKATIADYSEADDEAILEQIGIQLSAVERQTINASSAAEMGTYDGAVMGPMDDIRRIGLKLLKRLNSALYKLCCGDAQDDQEDRNKLLGAVGLGKEEVGVIIAGILISSFGVAPALAPLLGLLIAKRLIPIFGDTLCEEWKAMVSA